MATSSSTQDEHFWHFLRSRGIPEENVKKMQQERIDSSVVGELDDGTLANYVPAYGDRIALRRFCVENQQKGCSDARKISLLEKLKRKMASKTSNHLESDEEPSLQPAPTHLRKNKRAWKTTRKIEVGWIHDKKMVRKRNGGGTRIIDISKKATAKKILSQAKDLFFPKNESKIGMWEEFIPSIVDFQESPLDENVTVGELYEAHKFGILRFYLSTQTNADAISQEKEEDLHSHTIVNVTQQVMQGDSCDEHYVASFLPSSISREVDIVDLTSICDTSEVIIGATQGAVIGYLDDTVPLEAIMTDEPPDNAAPNTSTPIRFESGPCHLPAVPVELMHVTIHLHRVNLLEELITQFKDELVLTCPIKYSFIDEKGSDADGVSRDVYAAFWTEFLDCAAERADVRVPSLSPKWQEEEWRSVGRILIKGFQDHGYFPARLAPAFSAAVIFGEHSVSPDLLFDSLLLYLSQSERDLLATALKDSLVGDDRDELLDIMDRMGVRTVPTPDNLKPILLQVAHKQIIQHPKYALDNIATTAGPRLREMFGSIQELQKMYDDLKPTTRKVLKLLTASPSTQAENQSLKFFHQYVRGLDDMGLRKMLRYVTGSDVICVKEIEVIFTTLDGLERRPIIHTCGPTVELPSTYNSFPELRAELEALLYSNIYTMDII